MGCIQNIQVDENHQYQFGSKCSFIVLNELKLWNLDCNASFNPTITTVLRLDVADSVSQYLPLTHIKYFIPTGIYISSQSKKFGCLKQRGQDDSSLIQCAEATLNLQPRWQDNILHSTGGQPARWDASVKAVWYPLPCSPTPCGHWLSVLPGTSML